VINENVAIFPKGKKQIWYESKVDVVV